MRNKFFWGITGALLALFTAGRTDELILRDGRKIEGIVEKDGNEYLIRDGASAMRFPQYEVASIIRKPTLRQRYENLRDVTPENDIQEQLRLGRWCRKNNLPQEAKIHFARVLRDEPNNQEARRALGFQFHQGQWRTAEEVNRAKGLTLYQGKWLPQAEAERRTAEDALNNARESTRRQVQAILRQAAKLSPWEPHQELAKRLAAVSGPNIIPILAQAAMDTNLTVRDTVYQALALGGAPEALPTLMRRFHMETQTQLLKNLTEILGKWRPAESVLPKLMQMALHAEKKNLRKRAWPVLRTLADKRIIDALVAEVDFCPVPEEEQQRAQQTANSSTTSSSDPRPRKPYYPAQQLLVYLTNQNFAANEKEKWQEWWKENREEFDFRHPPVPAENTRETDVATHKTKMKPKKGRKDNEQKKEKVLRSSGNR